MNISENVLKRYIRLPETRKELRDLLDDIGIEVKRIESVGDDLRIGVELLANRGDEVIALCDTPLGVSQSGNSFLWRPVVFYGGQ